MVGVFGIMSTIPFLLLLLSAFSPAEQCPLRTFHLIEKKMNQSEARAACRVNYTDLVTVCSEDDNTALKNLTRNLTGQAWIGLQRRQVSSKWSNGDEVKFSPPNGSCGTLPCCAAMKTDASWESLLCTEARNFMCYKQDETDLTFSFHLITLSLTWYEAQSYCRKNYTDLVSIRDQVQNETVKTQGMNSNMSFWIGLLHDDLEWADGGRSAYRNWETDQPRPTSNCTVIRNGKWFSVPCSNNESALCYNKQSPLRTFHLIEEKMNQSEARAACRVNYTDLVTVYSEDDNTALKNLTINLNRKFWIGLQRRQVSSKWYNGDEVKFSPPNGSCGTLPCCAAMKTDASWESLLCTEARNFMCYKQDETDLTFSFHLITLSLTWYEAQSYCRKNYTDLVSIRDQVQNETVKTQGMNSNMSFWIGLLRDDLEWADGGRSAYRNWETGQPRPTSNCTVIKNGKWFSVPCSNGVNAVLCYNQG